MGPEEAFGSRDGESMSLMYLAGTAVVPYNLVGAQSVSTVTFLVLTIRHDRCHSGTGNSSTHPSGGMHG